MIHLNDPNQITRKYLFLERFHIPILLLGVCLLYVLSFSSLIINLSADIRYYLILPIIYLVFAGVAIISLRKSTHLRFIPRIFLYGIGSGLFYVLIELISGLIWGFGYSPYSHTLPGSIGNVFFLLISISSMEIIRAVLLHDSRIKNQSFNFVLVTILFTLFSIPAQTYFRTYDVETFFEVSAGMALPILTQNVLTSYFVWIGGPFLGIGYRLAISLVEYLAPILPDLTWMQKAFIGTISQLVILIFTYSIANSKVNQPETISADENNQKKFSYGWMIAFALGALIVWTNTGIFGIRFFLVSGTSMEPTFHTGDLVFITKPAADQISPGDIILFETTGGKVLHRVIALELKDENVAHFFTQGDANNVQDSPVSLDQYQGKSVFKIPWIGWLAVKIKENF